MSKEKTRFDPAGEVKEIAEELIGKYHQHIIDFSVEVRYFFVNKTPKYKGKDVWGSCRKMSGLNARIATDNPDGDEFFVITISRDIWDILPHDKRVALIDHELCHVSVELKQADNESDADVDAEIEQDNPVKLSVRPHDLEEFACIVRRHGLWRDDIEEFVNAALKPKEENNANSQPQEVLQES